MTTSKDKTVEEAAAHFHRRRDPDSSHSVEDILAWMDSDEKRQAYLKVATAWQDFDGLKETEQQTAPVDFSNSSDAELEASNNDYSVEGVPASSEVSPLLVAQQTPTYSRRFAAFAMTILLGLSLSVAAIFGYNGYPTEHYANIGDTKTVVLGDGTSIMLESKSHITVVEGWGRRQVTLHSGRAFFDVNDNPGKPFTVITRDVTTTVIGTQFSVNHMSGEVNVAVKEGAVRVEKTASDTDNKISDKRSVDLRPSEGVTLQAIGDKKPIPEKEDVNIETLLDWQKGSIEFDSTPLYKVVAKVNQYYPHKIQIVNSHIRDFAVSGTFNTDDVPGFMKAIEGLTERKIEITDNGIILIH